MKLKHGSHYAQLMDEWSDSNISTPRLIELAAWLEVFIEFLLHHSMLPLAKYYAREREAMLDCLAARKAKQD